MDINEALGAHVRHLREGRKLTQVEFAEKCGLSVDYIGRIERGTTSPTVKTAQQLANGLEVRISTLFELYEEEVQSRGSTTALVELSRYLRTKDNDDAAFAYSIIRQILDR